MKVSLSVSVSVPLPVCVCAGLLVKFVNCVDFVLMPLQAPNAIGESVRKSQWNVINLPVELHVRRVCKLNYFKSINQGKLESVKRVFLFIPNKSLVHN